MAVFYYAEGEHPAGFIGFRVATTLGASEEFRQEYFGFRDYSPRQAEQLANDLDERWRAQANDYKREARLKPSSRRNYPGVIVTGLRAQILVQKPRKSTGTIQIRPCFMVQRQGYGKGDKSFAIGKLGFDQAFRLAVETYALIHALSSKEVEHLHTLKPSRDLFIHTLRLNLVRRGVIITAADMEARLA